jgi:ribosomal protein S12 methylthiotransferase accessory factor
MLYSKRKDELPENTVKKIKDILKNYGLDNLTETFFKRKVDFSSAYSFHISRKNDNFFYSNGKSTTKSYAMASAYGELIERIQNGYFVQYKAPDCKQISVDELIKSTALNYFVKDKYKEEYLDYIIDLSTNYDKISNKIDVLPFGHFNSNTVEYLPISLIKFLSHSTGCCSGNTKYEALIEGLCEIFERYVNKTAVSEPISFPIIPRDIFMRYDEIAGIVNYIEKLGFSIEVYDASLDGKFPVVCICLRKGDREYYHFGSHPFLPIAIERSFTETFQGYDLSDDLCILKNFRKVNSKQNNNIASKIDNAIIGRYVEINKNPNIKPTYHFKLSNWKYDENITNKELLKLLLDKLLERNYNIFIRDVSFLSYPSFQVIIPELMSYFNSDNLCSGVKQRFNYNKCSNILSCKLDVDILHSEFIDFCEYFFHLNNCKITKIKNLEIYYLVALFNSIQIEKAQNILNLLQRSKKYSKILNKKSTIDFLKSETAFASVLKHLKKKNLFNLTPKEEIKKQRNEISDKLFETYKSNIPNQKDIIDQLHKL